VTRIGDTRLVTPLVTLIATKFAGETDICDAAANQITRTFGQLELIIVVSAIGFSELDPS
jgi:branched-subunit amino acid permease